MEIASFVAPISASETADKDLKVPQMKRVTKASSMENLCDPKMIYEFSNARIGKLTNESPHIITKRIQKQIEKV